MRPSTMTLRCRCCRHLVCRPPPIWKNGGSHSCGLSFLAPPPARSIELLYTMHDALTEMDGIFTQWFGHHLQLNKERHLQMHQHYPEGKVPSPSAVGADHDDGGEWSVMLPAMTNIDAMTLHAVCISMRHLTGYMVQMGYIIRELIQFEHQSVDLNSSLEFT
jgi:hypothetical protein